MVEKNWDSHVFDKWTSTLEPICDGKPTRNLWNGGGENLK